MGQQTQIGKVATTVQTQDGSTRVVYHNTTVVQFNQDLIVLDSGEWRTATTKSRMNQTSHQFNLGYRVYQENFDWFVRFNGKTLEFRDGIELNRSDYGGVFEWGDE